MTRSKKQKCEKCGRMLRSCKLRPHKLNKQLWCKICFRRYGENKFYTPQAKREKGEMITKYNITFAEKKALFRELVRSGLSPERARRRIKNDIVELIKTKIWRNKQKQKRAIQYEYKRREQSQNNKKFLAGLRQK